MRIASLTHLPQNASTQQRTASAHAWHPPQPMPHTSNHKTLWRGGLASLCSCILQHFEKTQTNLDDTIFKKTLERDNTNGKTKVYTHNTPTTPPQHPHNTPTTPPQHPHNTPTTPPQHPHNTPQYPTGSTSHYISLHPHNTTPKVQLHANPHPSTHTQTILMINVRSIKKREKNIIV